MQHRESLLGSCQKNFEVSQRYCDESLNLKKSDKEYLEGFPMLIGSDIDERKSNSGYVFKFDAFLGTQKKQETTAL